MKQTLRTTDLGFDVFFSLNFKRPEKKRFIKFKEWLRPSSHTKNKHHTETAETDRHRDSRQIREEEQSQQRQKVIIYHRVPTHISDLLLSIIYFIAIKLKLANNIKISLVLNSYYAATKVLSIITINIT